MQKKIFILLLFILSVYSFFIVNKDFTVDELDYIHFNNIDHNADYISQLISISANTDHFPLFNILKYTLWKFTYTPYSFRILMLILVLLNSYILDKILIFYKLEFFQRFLFFLMFIFHPLILVNTVFSSEYIFSMLFLSAFYFFLIKHKQKNKIKYLLFAFFFFIISILTNYLTLICGVLILLYFFSNKRLYIIIFSGILAVLMFILIFNIFSKTDSGQTEYTSILTQNMSNYSTSIYNVISSLSVIFIYPGLYIPYTVNNLASFLLGMIIISLILFMFKNKRYIVSYILIYISSIYIVSKLTEIKFGIILYEPYRLFFILPFILYLFIYFLKHYRKYRVLTILFLILIYTLGIYNFHSYYKDDIKEISKELKNTKIDKVYSLAYNYNGNFNDINILRYYINVKEIKSIPDNKIFYVFYRKMSHNNDFYLDKYNEISNIQSFYDLEIVYNGKNYKLLRFVPKIR